MRLAIVGGRDFNNYLLFKSALTPYNFTTVVSGGAHGADNLAERYAWQFNKKLMIFLPDWDKYVASTGPIHNKEIVQNSNGVIAFWDGKSRGTMSTIKYCQEINHPYKIVGY